MHADLEIRLVFLRVGPGGGALEYESDVPVPTEVRHSGSIGGDFCPKKGVIQWRIQENRGHFVWKRLELGVIDREK